MIDPLTKKILTIIRASLIQQAEGLAQQRRAILSQVGEIEKILEDTVVVSINQNDNISGTYIKSAYIKSDE